MSHKTTVKTELKDRQALAETCRRLGIPCEVAAEGQTVEGRLYQGPETGVATFTLPGWNYPVVVKEDGAAAFDNYGGKWGNIAELDRVKQEYACTLAETKVKASGLRIVSKTTLENGTIQIRATR